MSCPGLAGACLEAVHCTAYHTHGAKREIQVYGPCCTIAAQKKIASSCSVIHGSPRCGCRALLEAFHDTHCAVYCQTHQERCAEKYHHLTPAVVEVKSPHTAQAPCTHEHHPRRRKNTLTSKTSTPDQTPVLNEHHSTSYLHVADIPLPPLYTLCLHPAPAHFIHSHPLRDNTVQCSSSAAQVVKPSNSMKG